MLTIDSKMSALRRDLQGAFFFRLLFGESAPDPDSNLNKLPRRGISDDSRDQSAKKVIKAPSPVLFCHKNAKDNKRCERRCHLCSTSHTVGEFGLSDFSETVTHE
jgi:hypothetical protein